MPVLRSRFAAEGEPEDEGDRRRHQPPRVDAGGDEDGGGCNGDKDADGCAPVVPDDEVPPEQPERSDAPHANTTRLRLSSATAANEIPMTNRRTTGNAASSPGQLAPAPSTLQKIPNVVSITPTANFIEFSGTRASGARTARPTPATSTSAAAAPTAASGIEPCALPKVRTMNTTSSPSSSTPLNESVNPYQSTPARSTWAAPRASSSSRAKIASSSWSALYPLARRIALRSHCRPKTSRSAPTTRRSAWIGITVSAGPSATTTTASTSVAAPSPASEERQPRASPAARTIVNASTNSTPLARNAERKRKVSPVCIKDPSDPWAEGSRARRPRWRQPSRHRRDRCAGP